MSSHLELLIQEHLAMPFPESVDKGLDYGEIEPVMIGADIYGWATGVASGSRLDVERRQQLIAARAALERSIGALPEQARPYFELIVRLADATLAEDPDA